VNWAIPESAPLIAVFGWTIVGLCVVGGLLAARWIIKHVRFK
jgi:hypothetical protein